MTAISRVANLFGLGPRENIASAVLSPAIPRGPRAGVAAGKIRRRSAQVSGGIRGPEVGHRAPRILIFSASAGAGHLRAAEAIELALADICPEAQVVNVDVLSLTNAAFRHFYAQTYFDVIKYAPHFVGYLYDRLDKAPATPSPLGRRAALLGQSLRFGRAIELIESQPWDLAINTHFLSAQIIGLLRSAGRVHFPQVVATTDFYIHSMWIKREVDRYFAASDESAINMSMHLPATKIDVTGIPIHPAFGRPMDAPECRDRHGLSQDRPVVLQLAGGYGIGRIDAIHRALLESRRPMHLAVAAGRNAAAHERIERIDLPPQHRRTVLGFTKQMHELMAAADVVVSKPGGLTTSEAMATGTPMLIVDPIPGQESRNSDFLLEHGAAAKMNTLASLAYKLESLLGDEHRLTTMAAAARRVGRPHAAADVVRRAMGLLAHAS